MRVNAEKVIATFVVLSFTLTLMSTLIVAGNSLTKEEAIEISRNSKLVQSLLEDADRYTLEVHYQNKTESGKEHGIWLITWYIHPTGATSAFAFVISHAIDEETGEILYEGTASAR